MEVAAKTPLSSNNYRLGWFGFEPAWLQTFNTATWFLVWMFITNAFQSLAVNGLVGVVLSTLERRFGFTSTESSWIPGVYDAAGIPIILYLSYVGTRVHRPRWIFIGQLMVFAGTILFVLPHFTTDVYTPNLNQTDDYVCDVTQELDRTCDALAGTSNSVDTGLQGYLAVFILARILQGIGAQPLLMLGTTFLDDVTSKERFSLYVAIFSVGGIFGPAVGYVLGGYALTIYTEFYQVDADSLGITPVDARWVGAWWLDFLLAAIFVFIFAFPFSVYASDLPGAAEIRMSKVSEAHNDRQVSTGTGSCADDVTEEQDAANVHISLSEIPSYLKTVLINPSFVAVVIFCTCDVILIAGFTAFGPKYIETQFSQSPTIASMLFGLTTIPGGIGGTILGGWLIKRFKLSVSSIIKWMCTFALLTICCVPIFFFRCEPPPFAGVTDGYNNTELSGILENEGCFSGCSCTNITFTPVCGVDNILYFSPCHAGCQSSHENPDYITYYNCSCVTSHMEGEPDATSKPCVNDRCTYFPPFLVLFLFAMLFIFTADTMVPTLLMRVVPATHRTMGLGVSSVVTRLLGGLTGPLIFGMAFDNACELWDEHCGKKGSCLTYNRGQVAFNIAAICFGVKLISFVAIIVAWKFYKPPTSALSLLSDRKYTDSSFSGSAVMYENKGFEDPAVSIVTADAPRSVTNANFSLRPKRGSYDLTT